MSEPLSPSTFETAVGTDDWRVIGDGACTVFRTDSLAAGLRLMAAIADLPDLVAHQPDADLRHDTVHVRLITITDAYWGLTQRDLDLARLISLRAADQGLTADPSLVQNVQVAIDALVSADVMPFWRAVLGYEFRSDTPDEDVVDPRGRGPNFWFQQMDESRPQRNRIHIDVYVPHDQAEARVAAGIAAGGLLVSAHAPEWWTLADPEGNEVDIASITARG